MLRRQRQLRRLVNVAFVVGVVVLVAAARQLLWLSSDGDIPAPRERLTCKLRLLYMYANGTITRNAGINCYLIFLADRTATQYDRL